MSRRASIIALLIGVLSAALLLGFGTRSALRIKPDSGPQRAIEKAQQERREARAKRAEAVREEFDTPFDMAMVKDQATWKADGITTLDLAVVNATEGADLAVTARECRANALAPRGQQVACYVFASQEAFDALNMTKTARANLPEDQRDTVPLTNLCYAVASRILDGKEVLSDLRDAPALWESRGCPDSWYGSDDKGKRAATAAAKKDKG